MYHHGSTGLLLIRSTQGILPFLFQSEGFQSFEALLGCCFNQVEMHPPKKKKKKKKTTTRTTTTTTTTTTKRNKRNESKENADKNEKAK